MAKEKTKKKFTFPSAFTILFILLIVIAAADLTHGAHRYRPCGGSFAV